MGFQHYDKDKLKEIARRAGKKRNPRKGFGSMTFEQRQTYGAAGGKKSRRKKLSTDEEQNTIA